MSGTRGIYLDQGGEPVFALFDPPAAASRSAGPPAASSPSAGVGAGRLGVLICPPWGWDEVASYRSRRRWAEMLAAAGHPVLRLDLPGSGDSAGGPDAPDLLDRWIEAIGLGGEWLRGEGGAPGLALLGLVLGALLATEAVARGLPAAELVCWGAPPSGRHFGREMKAFAGLQAGRPAEPAGRPPALPDGWLEAGGFLLSAATLAGLKGLAPGAAPGSRRALLIGRDGVADTAGAARLAVAGVEVSEDPGSGWGAFVGHPETTALPTGVERVVRGWLGRAAGDAEGVGDRAEAPPASLPAASGRADFGDHTEEPVRIELPHGEAFGILARPAAATVAAPSPAAAPCAVFLNAGAIRHVGPSRLWTEAARRLARGGVPSLRVDLESIGEADGDETRRATVADFYDPAFVAQVAAVLDWLEAAGVARRFRLVGLCAGGYWAFQAALADPRVETALLLNAGALIWHPGILAERDDRRLVRVFKRHWWGMLARREVKASAILNVLRVAPAGLARLLGRLRGRRGAAGGAAIDAALDSLPAGRRLVMAFSGSEPLREELAALGVLGRLARWPGVELRELPGADHTLRPIVAQRAALELIERELGSAGRAGYVASPSGAQR